MTDPNQLFREIAGDVAADRLDVSPIVIDGRHGFQAQIKGTAWKCSITTGYELDADDKTRILGDLACLATQDYPFGIHPDCDPKNSASVNDDFARYQQRRSLANRIEALPESLLPHVDTFLRLMESMAREEEGISHVRSMLQQSGRSTGGPRSGDVVPERSSGDPMFDEQERRIAAIYGRRTVLL